MTDFTQGARVYVDECKTKGYYVAAAAVMPHMSADLDKALRKLTRPGQHRIHFTNEADSSKRKLISEITRLGISVVVYQVRGLPDRTARPLCLAALIENLASARCSHVIFERDESIEKTDRRVIAETLRRNGHYPLRYEHASPNEHALLWVSDMVAWCSYKGGDWLRRVQPIIAATHTLTL